MTGSQGQRSEVGVGPLKRDWGLQKVTKLKQKEVAPGID